MPAIYPSDSESGRWVVDLCGPQQTPIEIVVKLSADQAGRIMQYENKRRQKLQEKLPGVPVAGPLHNLAEGVMSALMARFHDH